MKELLEANERQLHLLDALKKSYRTIQDVEEISSQAPEHTEPMIWWYHPTDGQIITENDSKLHLAMRGMAAGVYSELKDEGLKEVADEIIEIVLFEK